MPEAQKFTRLLPAAQPAEFAIEHLNKLGRLMSEINRGGESQGIPSGYVYLGQFIDHDMTRLASGDDLPDGHGMPLDMLEQLRTPNLDLDSVYGTGFDDPACATATDGKMVLGTTTRNGQSAASNSDLPRHKPSGLAIIPDDRNDENLFVAQLHVLFLHLHNALIDKLDDSITGAGERFEVARAEVIHIYQSIILNDFLPALLDPDILAWLTANDGEKAGTLYHERTPAMPVEFAGAAFRFGHSMIRHNYKVNDKTSVGLRDLLGMTGKGGMDGKASLPESHVVDWQGFFFADPITNDTNRARRIDQHMVDVLRIQELADEAGTEINPADFLASRNLVRGLNLGLPSGQELIDSLLSLHPELTQSGVRQLTPEEIDFRDAFRELPDGHNFGTRTPLWLYILAEANAIHDGLRLGPAGSVIIGATIIGILKRTHSQAITKLHEIDQMLKLLNFVRQSSGKGSVPGQEETDSEETHMQDVGSATSILDFVGEFEAGELEFPDHSHSNKEGYYPPAGLRIRFDLADFVSLGRGEDYKQGLKVTVTHAPGGTWEGTAGLEAAYFYYIDGRLVSTPIETNVRDDANDRNITFTEVIETRVDRIENGVKKWKMIHFLLWDDGDRGSWYCVGPP